MTPEPFLFGILMVLGSYLLAVVASNITDNKKDPLRNFQPFNLKNYVTFFSKNKNRNR